MFLLRFQKNIWWYTVCTTNIIIPCREHRRAFSRSTEAQNSFELGATSMKGWKQIWRIQETMAAALPAKKTHLLPWQSDVGKGEKCSLFMTEAPANQCVDWKAALADLSISYLGACLKANKTKQDHYNPSVIFSPKTKSNTNTRCTSSVSKPSLIHFRNNNY